MKQRPTSVHLTFNSKEVLKRLSRYLGISQAAVIALAIRKLARLEGLDISDLQDEDEQGDTSNGTDKAD